MWSFYVGRLGRPRKIQDLLEQAVVQLFVDHVDLTIEEALEWLKEEFTIELSKATISTILRNHNVTHKRLKFVAAQRNPELRADYLKRMDDMTAEQLVFLDESAANEFTKDRKTGWSLKGCPAVKERDFRRSERWSILPAYTRDGYMGWRIFQGSYTTAIFNDFVLNEVLPKMNAWSDREPVSPKIIHPGCTSTNYRLYTISCTSSLLRGSSDASRDDIALFPPAPAQGSSPLALEDPRDIDLYIQWFSVREPHNADSIEVVAATLNHDKDTLSTLEKMSEARIERVLGGYLLHVWLPTDRDGMHCRSCIFAAAGSL
jgi:hypothetical protein